MRVRAEVEVVKVEGRAVTFRVAVNDEKEPIGDGTHERVVVKRIAIRCARAGEVAMVRDRK